MKLIIDIPEKVVTAIQNGEDYRYDIHTAIAQGIPYEERPIGDLISRSELKTALDTIKQIGYDTENKPLFDYVELPDLIKVIDTAPTVDEIPQGDWVRKEDIICYIATQYSEHNELVPVWLNIGDLKGGAE